MDLKANWMTTTAGVLAGVSQVAVPLLSTGHVTWSSGLTALFTFLIGFFAKDSK